MSDEDDTIEYFVGTDEPIEPVVGSLWYHTIRKKFYVFDGDHWIVTEPEDIVIDDTFETVEDAYDRAMGVL